MKKIIFGSLAFALFFGFSSVFANDLGTQKCSDYTYPKDSVKSDNFYLNQKFCEAKDEFIYSVDILDKNYKYTYINDATGKDEYYTAVIVGKKDGKKHTKIYLNGKKVLDILSDSQKHETSELTPRNSISTYGNHSITTLGYYEGLSQLSSNDLAKGGLYIDGVKVFGNIGQVENFLQNEYIDYLNWNEENIPEKYKNVKLSPADIAKYSKVITQFNERKYTKEKKEEIFNRIKEYSKLSEEKMKTGKITDQGFRNFLIINYIYTELKIKSLKDDNVSKKK
ncbi:hypothetical protein BLD25_00140 [Candidatus Gracilibacteria bacterium GN02-872]|nr:hypothetical protein BLD25_00140 [Candidatus Gracilibacteria bacterium GN02-872]